MDVGSVNVTAGSYIVFRTARLRNTTSRTSNADCDLHNPAGGNGIFENVNLSGTNDRKVISALSAQAVTSPSTFALACKIALSGSVDVDEVAVAVAAIKIDTLH
jgi:hypothetical protein